MKVPHKISNHHNIFKWIIDQPDSFIDKLYGERGIKGSDDVDVKCNSNSISEEIVFACKAIFQSLSPLSKLLVMRLCFLDFIRIDEIHSWIKEVDEQQEAISQLKKFRILIPKLDSNTFIEPNTSKEFLINNNFRKHFIYGITYSSEPWADLIKSISSEHLHCQENIDNIAITKWDVLLRYIMNLLTSNDINQPSKSITEFFKKHMNLLTEQNQLTSNGYEFMLKEYHSQIWDVIWKIIENLPNQEESISFLFMLSYCQPNRGYPVKPLTKIQKQILVACYDIGIIYINRAIPSIFYPTSAAVNLVFKLDHHSKSVDPRDTLVSDETVSPMDSSMQFVKLNELQIIVETNMQVVAYITSELHVALLRLFIDINVRLPNMVIGRITRDKAKQAFRVGITVTQMIDFLSSHSHQIVMQKKQEGLLPVPENVIDQLVLWQAEDHRINEQDAEVVIFDPSQVTSGMFHEFVTYMNRLNACLWYDSSSMQMAVTISGYESLVSLLGDQIMGEYT